MEKKFSAFVMRLFLLTLAITFMISCTPSVEVSSPDGDLTISLTQNSENQLLMSIAYKGDTLISPSPIGLEFDEGAFGKGVTMSKGKVERIVEEYDMPVGKVSHIYSESYQCVVSLTSADGHMVDLCLRAFNDGVAFRYLFPEQETVSQLRIKREIMELHPTGDPVLKAMYLCLMWTVRTSLHIPPAV